MATKLLLNNMYELIIDGYNRYTNINDGQIMSHASVTLSNLDQYDVIDSASRETITDLKIFDDTLQIYHLSNQNAKITNISESLNSGRIIVTMQITFNMNVNAQE